MCHIRSLASSSSNFKQLRHSSKSSLRKSSISRSSQSLQRLQIRKICKAYPIMCHQLKSGKTQDHRVILALKRAIIHLRLIKKMPCRSLGRHQFRQQLYHLTLRILDQLPKPLSLLSRRNQRKKKTKAHKLKNRSVIFSCLILSLSRDKNQVVMIVQSPGKPMRSHQLPSKSLSQN